MNEFLKAKRLELFIIITAVAVAGVGYALTRAPKSTQIAGNNQSVQQASSSSVVYDGQDGRNALDLLKVFNRVETKDTSFGPQVVGINGLIPDEKTHYWAFYVNGSLAQVGADQYVTKNGDKIEWKVEGF